MSAGPQPATTPAARRRARSNAAPCAPATSTAPRDGGALKPAAARRRGKASRLDSRADAGFANPEVHERLESQAIKYAIRSPANRVLQERIGRLPTRPVGRAPNEARRSFANFADPAGSRTKPRRVVAKAERRPGERHPRAGFIAADTAGPAENAVAFHNMRGTRGDPRRRRRLAVGRSQRRP
jgi:hypothetical protein